MKYPYEEIKEENEIELKNNPYFSVILRKKKIVITFKTTIITNSYIYFTCFIFI